MNTMTKLLGGAALSVTLATAAMAETLTISSWVPPNHHVNTEMLPSLTKMMEDATGGEITAEVKMGLAPPPAQFDLVLDGAVDMAYIFPGYQPGRYVGTKLIELPGFGGDAEAASAAYWKVYEQHLAALDEYRGVKVIAVFTHGPGQFHTDADVNTLGDLKDLKIRIGGGVAGEVGTALGVKGVRVPAPKVYETLASDVADGVAMDVASRTGFKLTEVAKNMYEMPGGFYRGAFALIMSQEKFDSLSPEVQKALDEQVFGLTASKEIGRIWAKADGEAVTATEATEGNSIRVASDEDRAAFAEIAATVRDNVIAEITAKGADGQAAYDMLKAELGDS